MTTTSHTPISDEVASLHQGMADQPVSDSMAAFGAEQRALVPALRERGVNLVAISPQKPDGSVSAIEANELTFTVVSDPGNILASALGILTAPTEDAQAAQQQLGLDLRTVNADGTTAVPMPTVAIVDADGVLRWIDLHPNYTSRTEPADVLAALDTASRS